MTALTMIVLATLFGGLLSMAAAAGLAFRLSRKATATLVAFAAGVMLSSALLEILPEAFASLQQHTDAAEHASHAHDGPAATLFAVLLAGLFGFSRSNDSPFGATRTQVAMRPQANTRLKSPPH